MRDRRSCGILEADFLDPAPRPPGNDTKVFGTDSLSRCCEWTIIHSPMTIPTAYSLRDWENARNRPKESKSRGRCNRSNRILAAEPAVTRLTCRWTDMKQK